MAKNTLVVIIKSARDLKDKDGLFSGQSDPYVRLRIVADDDHSQVVHLKHTTVKNGAGANPIWNEKFQFSNLKEPGAYTLKLNVLDKDWLTRDDPLGETTIDLGTLTDAEEYQDYHDVWIDGWVWKSYLSFSVSTVGGWGNTPGPLNSLVVKVKNATDLREADGGWSGKNDPYVLLTVTDAKGETINSQKTTVKEEGGTNVKWNEEFTFESLEYPSAARLRLDVFDKDKFTKDDSLGTYTLHLGVLKNDDAFQDYDVRLRGKSGDSARLSFAVTNLGGWGHSKPPPAIEGAPEQAKAPCICC